MESSRSFEGQSFSDVLQRKVRSGLTRGLDWTEQSLRTACLRRMHPRLRLGPGAQIGRGVRIRIFDGGQIDIGKNVTLESGVRLQVQAGRIVIGDDTFVGAGSDVVALSSVEIGRDVLIAAGCVIRDADHEFRDWTRPIRTQGHCVAPLAIEDDVWLGAHVVVTRGVRVGKGAVIGANAVVSRTIPAYAIAVGLPARVVGNRQDGPQAGQPR